MKKLLLFITILFISVKGYSEHIVGYDMTVENIDGTDSYKFKLKIYRDNTSLSSPLPTSMQFTIYNKSTNLSTGISFHAHRVHNYFSSGNAKGCVIQGRMNSLETGEYEYVISEVQALSLSSSNQYYIAAEVCCRSSSTNLPASNQFPFLFIMDLNNLSEGSTTRYNSSPIFNSIPGYIFVVDRTYTLDWSANDKDGDSLVYSIVPPIGDNLGSYPFSSLEYAPGYKLDSNIADGAPDFNINASSGLGTYHPTQAGNYLVAVKVEEYRNGIKIGEVRREIQFLTLVIVEHPPVISTHNSTKDVVDTIDFAGNYSVDYNLQFHAVDTSIDSLFMYIVPEEIPTSNIFETIILKAEWGEVGNTQTGDYALGLVLQGEGTLSSEFKWKIYDYMGKNTPYRFKVIVKDLSCPDGFKDTMNVSIYVPVTGCFYNITETLYGCDSLRGGNGKMYYQSGVYFDVKRVDFACDTTYLQYILIDKSPTKKNIVGATQAQPLTDYTYYFYPEQQNFCYWTVDYGTVMSQNDSIAVIRFNSHNQSKITVVEYGASGCFTINRKLVNESGVGIQDEEKASFVIFPNPSSSKIYIDGLTQETVVQIYSVDGKKLYSTSVKDNEEIDISNLQPGVYILKVEGQSKRILKM